MMYNNSSFSVSRAIKSQLSRKEVDEKLTWKLNMENKIEKTIGGFWQYRSAIWQVTYTVVIMLLLYLYGGV